MREQTPMWTVAANTLNKQSQTANNGWFPDLGLDEVLTTPHGKNWSCYKTDTHASGLDWSFGMT